MDKIFDIYDKLSRRQAIRKTVGSLFIPWDDHEEYRYAAMDANGQWYIYRRKPYANQGGKVWSSGDVCIRVYPVIPESLKSKITVDNWENCVVSRVLGISRQEIEEYVKNYPVFGGYFVGSPDPVKPTLKDIISYDCYIAPKRILRRYKPYSFINDEIVPSQWNCVRNSLQLNDN